MAKHKTGTRQEWLAARLELLQAEKQLTRQNDEMARGDRSCRGCGSQRNTNSISTTDEKGVWWRRHDEYDAKT